MPESITENDDQVKGHPCIMPGWDNKSSLITHNRPVLQNFLKNTP